LMMSVAVASAQKWSLTPEIGVMAVKRGGPFKKKPLPFLGGVWGAAVFNSLGPARPIRRQEPARITAPISAATRVNDFFRSAGDSISAALTNILPRADAAPADAK